MPGGQSPVRVRGAALSRAAPIAAVLLAAASHVAAGPWVPDRGHFYAKLGYHRLATTDLATPDGSTREIPRFLLQQATLYSEVGIGSGLALVLDATLHHRSEIDGFGRAGDAGDVRFGLKGEVLRRNGWVLGLRAIGQAPTGDESRGEGLLPTGSGTAEAMLLASSGWSIGSGRGWAFIEAGRLVRSGLTDGTVYEAQAGLYPTARWFLALNLRGVEPDGDARRTPGAAAGLGDRVAYATLGPSAGLGDRVAYATLGPSAGLILGKGWGLQIDADRTVHAENLATGTTWRAGLFWQR